MWRENDLATYPTLLPPRGQAPCKQLQGKGWKHTKLTEVMSPPLLFIYVIIFAVGRLGLRSYTMSHSTSPFFVMGVFKIGYVNYLPGLALNLYPPDLCFPSSWDYRRAPLHLAFLNQYMQHPLSH
jgi:hypothetical protein